VCRLFWWVTGRWWEPNRTRCWKNLLPGLGRSDGSEVDGPLDIVGDVHGEIDALHSLMRHLGYQDDGMYPDDCRHVSGSGTVSGVILFGNVNIGSGSGAITLEDVTLSGAATTTFEVEGTDTSQFDQLTLVDSVTLAGTAQITFDNFTPDSTNTFQLIDLTNGTASSWFSSVVASTGWTLSMAVPEPSSTSAPWAHDPVHGGL